MRNTYKWTFNDFNDFNVSFNHHWLEEMSHFGPGFFHRPPLTLYCVFPADWEVEEFGGGDVKTQEAHTAGSFEKHSCRVSASSYFSTNPLMHNSR